MSISFKDYEIVGRRNRRNPRCSAREEDGLGISPRPEKAGQVLAPAWIALVMTQVAGGKRKFKGRSRGLWPLAPSHKTALSPFFRR